MASRGQGKGGQGKGGQGPGGQGKGGGGMGRDRKPSASRGGGKSGMARPAKGAPKGRAPAAKGMARPARGAAPAGPAKTGIRRGPKGAVLRNPGAPERDRGLGGEQVEGRQAVRELLMGGHRRVRELWIANDLDDQGAIADILDLATDQRVPVTEVSRRKLELEARSEAPQGVLAKAAPLREADLDDLLKPKKGIAPFLVAVDGVTDPGNLGALLRSAEGAGVTGVLLPKHRAVHVTPTVAKAAAGAVEHLPMAIVPGLPTALRVCKERGAWIVGLDDEAEKSLFDLGDLGREPIVLVLGAEGAGLSRLVRERCDLIVSIPMFGRLSSLNVSAAGALACFEVARQRVVPAPG